jgi:beta-glucosidase-like glycosyl hydrolase
MDRLNSIELAPFKALMNKGIGVMVAHLYVPSLESGKGIPLLFLKILLQDY